MYQFRIGPQIPITAPANAACALFGDASAIYQSPMSTANHP
jgi:hypothetical protein